MPSLASLPFKLALNIMSDPLFVARKVTNQGIFIRQIKQRVNKKLTRNQVPSQQKVGRINFRQIPTSRQPTRLIRAANIKSGPLPLPNWSVLCLQVTTDKLPHLFTKFAIVEITL